MSRDRRRHHRNGVRLVLLPVLLRLGGHHIWHQPPWLARILPKVRFSH